MLTQVFWALFCAMLTVLLHSTYAYRLIIVLRRHSRSLHHTKSKENTLQPYIFVEAVLMLLLLHVLEAGIWGAFYCLHPEGLPDFATAIYFSLVSYTTIGYGDVLLSPSLRIVGAMEGVVGTFMFGLSIGLIVAIVQRTSSYQKIRASDA